MNIYPLPEYLVIEKPIEAKTSSGFLLSKESQESSSTVSVVLRVGEAVKSVKIGDRIIHRTYTNTEVKLKDGTYTLLKEDDILAIIKE